jgi:hypothetical protein
MPREYWPGARRTDRVVVRLTEAEAADLDRVALAWSVTRSAAASLILRDRLARWRRRAPNLGPMGLIAAASAAVLLIAVPGRKRHSRGEDVDE